MSIGFLVAFTYSHIIHNNLSSHLKPSTCHLPLPSKMTQHLAQKHQISTVLHNAFDFYKMMQSLIYHLSVLMVALIFRQNFETRFRKHWRSWIKQTYGDIRKIKREQQSLFCFVLFCLFCFLQFVCKAESSDIKLKNSGFKLWTDLLLATHPGT